MNVKKWQANWIEPTQEEAIEELPLTLEESILPGTEFGDGSIDLKPCKEIKFEFFIDSENLNEVAFICASAHGVYELRLNGEKIGDAFLAPETTNYNKLIWYQTYNISKQLKCGKNDLRIYLADGWYIGRVGLNGESCQYGNKLGFIGQIEVGKKIIPIDDTAVSRNFFIKYSDLYIGEKWDLCSEEAKWEPCFEADYPKDILKLQPTPSMKYIDELPMKELIITPEGDMVLDFGQVCAGVVELKVDVNKKTEIVLEHAEVLSKEGNFRRNIIGRFKDQRDVFIVDEKSKGTTLCPIFTFHGFRYVKITGLEKENIISAKIKVIGTPLERVGEFTTNHELINKLQHAITWSEISNMMSVPTDCPQRERMGWTGDILAFAPTGAFLFDLKQFLETWLFQLRLDQLDNGEVPVVIPNHPAQDAMQRMISKTSSCAAWSDVCVILPLYLYKIYGDATVLRDNFETMKRWLEYIESVDWGHLMHFGDWLIPSLREQPDGPMKGAMATAELVAWCYYCITLNSMIEVCEVLNEDASHYIEKLSETQNKILNDYISEDGSVCSKTLQGQYVIAIKSGALDNKLDLKEKVLRKLVCLIEENNNCLDTGFASVPYLLEVLYENGYEDLAYKVLFNTNQPSWLYMVTKGATTIWENWNAIRKDGTVTDYSYNHYAFGCVGIWMYEHIGGLKPLLPGYKKIKVAPDRQILKDYGLTDCTTRYKTQYGWITIKWNENEIKVDAPKEVEVIYG